MRNKILTFVRQAIYNQKKALSRYDGVCLKQDDRPYAVTNGYAKIMAEQYARACETLEMWEAMLAALSAAPEVKFKAKICPHGWEDWDRCPDCCH